MNEFMNDLLAQSIAATNANAGGGAPTIVSENHDLDQINWVNGLTDPGEMISCGYLPNIRRLQGEADREYAARITPIVMQLPKAQRDLIMNAAIRRFGVDATTGRVALMVAGEAAWSGLGVQIAEATDSANAIILASLNWEVKKTPLKYVNPVTGEVVDSGLFGVIRQDTGAILSKGVSKIYQPHQNAEGFKFLDSVLGEFDAKYESAGALYGGKAVWMLCRLPNQSFTIGRSDENHAYAIFVNWHDGETSGKCFPTNKRVECANTFRIAHNDQEKGITLRHVGTLNRQIEEAKKVLGTATRDMGVFREKAEYLATKPLVDIAAYHDNVLDLVCDLTAADMKKDTDVLAASLAVTEVDFETNRRKIERQKGTRTKLLDELLERYESPRCNNGGGTAWDAWNSVTESADHGKLGGRYIGDDKASRKFENVLSGKADQIKQDALEIAIRHAA